MLDPRYRPPLVTPPSLRRTLAVETFKDLVVSCEVLAKGTPGVHVTYESGRFVYNDSRSGRSWIRRTNLTEQMVRQHRSSVRKAHMLSMLRECKVDTMMARSTSSESEESGESKPNGRAEPCTTHRAS